MLSSFAVRFFHLGRSSLAPAKSHLAALRKKTGYTFSNCKKALELNNNDLALAEKWLQEQAQALGWSKATKLEGRQTSQGLIGIAVKNNNAAIVEVNCETDFVARNQQFQDMVSLAASACLQFALKQPCSSSSLTKIGMDAEQLRQIPAIDGKPLSDHLALVIGNVGENASLRRALCFKGKDSNVCVSSYVHPQIVKNDECSSVQLGRFGALVAIKHQSSAMTDDIQKVIKEVCQHIVGMKPLTIGNPDIDKPAKNVDDETCLIFQEYLLDDSVTVKEVLDENDLEIIEFKRFECGEVLESQNEENLREIKSSA